MVRADKSILSGHAKHRLELKARPDDGSCTAMQRRETVTTKHPSGEPWRMVRPCLLGGALTAAALLGRHGVALGGPPETTPASDAGGASHGALAMDRQEAML